MFLTWVGRLLKRVAAVSWKVPDSLGIHSSGATEDLKLYADTAWVLSLRYSGYHSSPKKSPNHASVYNFFGGGVGGRRGRLGEQGLLLAMRKRRIFASQFNEAPYRCAAICISVILGLLLAMRKRRIFASQFNEAPYCCAAICISVIYRCLLEKLLPSEFLEVFFFLIALCSLLSLWRPRLQCNHAEKQRKMTIFKLHGGCCYNNLIICHECPLTELFCYSYLLRLRKNN